MKTKFGKMSGRKIKRKIVKKIGKFNEKG